jgi:hypothetical protein
MPAKKKKVATLVTDDPPKRRGRPPLTEEEKEKRRKLREAGLLGTPGRKPKKRLTRPEDDGNMELVAEIKTLMRMTARLVSQIK